MKQGGEGDRVGWSEKKYALFGKSFLNIDKCAILSQGQEIVINT